MTDFKHGLWYPILLAPQDGTRILIFDNDEFAVAFWDIETREWDVTCYRGDGYQEAALNSPSHFMPLPNPPEDL